MIFTPFQPLDAVPDVSFHERFGGSAEHPNPAGVQQQQQGRGVGEGRNDEQVRFRLRRSERRGSLGNRPQSRLELGIQFLVALAPESRGPHPAAKQVKPEVGSRGFSA